MFFWHDRRESPSGSLERCFTDSLDGVSEAPFSALNLGLHVGDDERAVRVNRERVSAQLGGVPIAWMDQVHGASVAEVTLADVASGQAGPSADAMVSRDSGLALGVMVADCTPVLLSDDAAGVIGVAHAGRPGMLAGVVPAALEAMRHLGARDISAVLGPSICGRCYEVPREMHDAARQAHPASAAITWTGTPAIDVAAGVASQLTDAGVPLEWVPGCTREEPRLYSYRRDGATGRFAGLIVRKAAVS